MTSLTYFLKLWSFYTIWRGIFNLFFWFLLEPERDVILLYEDWKPEDRVECALRCLPAYSPRNSFTGEVNEFRYWKIRDYAYAYHSKLLTPSIVSETSEEQRFSFSSISNPSKAYPSCPKRENKILSLFFSLWLLGCRTHNCHSWRS